MSTLLESRLSVDLRSRTMQGHAMSDARPRFTEVYKTHRHALYTFVYYRVGQNRDIAEDVVSDVFVKAYRHYDSYNPDYAITTWLYTIARNTLIDHYRTHHEHIDIDDLPLEDTAEPLYQLITRSLYTEEVTLAIRQLPPLQQALIEAQFFQGKSAKEVAKERGMSHDAVRKQVSRAVATLRDLLLSAMLVVQNFIHYLS